MKHKFFNSRNDNPFIMHVEGEGGNDGGGNIGGSNPWYHGADAELVGHIQNKGWHDKPANEVALAAIQAHREAERYIGAPADQIIRLPKDASDEAGARAMWGRLGVPEKADGYDFSSIVGEDGKPALSEAQVAFYRETAHKLNIPASAAVDLARSLLKRDVDTAAATAADTTAKLTEEHRALDANWGQNKDINLLAARKGAEKLGFSPEQVQALENIVGYAKVMEAFRQVGELSGEMRFVNNGQPNFNNGVMTREQAAARLTELKADQAWVSKYLAGDAAAAREMLSLNTIMVGDDTEASRRF